MAALVTLGGCAQGPKLADYVPPKLDKSQQVELAAGSGIYVTVVDGMAVKGTSAQFASFGGNIVMLAPGHHRLTLSENRGGAGLNFGPNLFSTHAIERDFEAGHHYFIGYHNLFSNSMSITDKTTGQETEL